MYSTTGNEYDCLRSQYFVVRSNEINLYRIHYFYQIICRNHQIYSVILKKSTYAGTLIFQLRIIYV